MRFRIAERKGGVWNVFGDGKSNERTKNSNNAGTRSLRGWAVRRGCCLSCHLKSKSRYAYVDGPSGPGKTLAPAVLSIATPLEVSALLPVDALLHMQVPVEDL